MIYCCDQFRTAVERKEIAYIKKTGAFWFYFKRDYEDSFGLHYLGFCPYCGTKLPKNRTRSNESGESIYYDEIEKAVGKEFWAISEDEIPEEFKTDEWWKKRGL